MNLTMYWLNIVLFCIIFIYLGGRCRWRSEDGPEGLAFQMGPVARTQVFRIGDRHPYPLHQQADLQLTIVKVLCKENELEKDTQCKTP